MSAATGRLAGRRALITGAAGGIAQATALAFAREGAAVVMTDIDLDGAIRGAEQVKAQGGQAVALAADVTDQDSFEAMMANATADLGGIDILVTCAGGYKAYANFADMDVAEWRRIIEMNLTSVFISCQAVLPGMKARKWGRIVNLGSLAGRSTSAGTSPPHYGTAKAGVAMLTQYIAKEVAPFGITANTVAPGTTRTPRVDALLTPEKREQFVRATPVGYLAAPEDMTGLIVFLASEESRYITGATIDVNGGRLMLM